MMITARGLDADQLAALVEIERRGPEPSAWNRGRLGCLRLYADAQQRQRIDAIAAPVSDEPDGSTLLARAVAEFQSRKGASR